MKHLKNDPSFRPIESPSLVVCPDNTLLGIQNKVIFRSDHVSIGNLSELGLPSNSLHMQSTDMTKGLYYFPEDFPPEDLQGLSLMNRLNPIIPLSTDDILQLFDRFPNLKILHLDGFEINQPILDMLITKNIKMLALIRVNGVDLKSIVCSEIDTIIIEEKTFEANKDLEIESCRKIIRD